MQEIMMNNDNIQDPELDKLLSDREKYRIEKEMQAKALIDKFSDDPKSAVTANISKNTLELINADDKFRQQINKISKNTAQVAIDEVGGKNRKSKNENYFLGREEAITSLGGNSKTSKDKQIYINFIYNFWWYISMTFLGILYIAPLKVLLNWAKALSPSIIRNTVINGQQVNEEIHSLHWLPLMFSLIFYLAYLCGLGYLIYLFINAII